LVLSALAQSSEIHPTTKEARAALLAGRYDDAVNILTKITEEDPLSEEAWLLLGVAHSHTRQLKAAVADESKAIELMPSDAQAWTNRATIESDLGKYDRATADASEAIRLQPSIAAAYIARATARAGRRDFDGAEHDATAAINLDPGGRTRGSFAGMRARLAAHANSLSRISRNTWSSPT